MSAPNPASVTGIGKKTNNIEVCERMLGREISALITEIRGFFWDRKKTKKQQR